MSMNNPEGGNWPSRCRARDQQRISEPCSQLSGLVAVWCVLQLELEEMSTTARTSSKGDL